MEANHTHIYTERWGRGKKSILKLLPSNLWLFEFAFVWNMQKILYLWPKNKHCFYAVTSIEIFFLLLSHFHALSWLNKVFFHLFISVLFFSVLIFTIELCTCVFLLFFLCWKKAKNNFFFISTLMHSHVLLLQKHFSSFRTFDTKCPR